MDVIDSLPCPGPAVDYDAKPVLGNPFLLSQPRSHLKNMADEIVVFLAEIEDRLHMLARNNQNMDRRSRTNIPEGDHGWILVNEVPLHFALYDPTKKTVAHWIPP